MKKNKMFQWVWDSPEFYDERTKGVGFRYVTQDRHPSLPPIKFDNPFDTGRNNIDREYDPSKLYNKNRADQEWDWLDNIVYICKRKYLKLWGINE